MGYREVTANELIETVWKAEDRLRLGASCLATRKLRPKGELYLTRSKLGGRFVWTLVAVRWSRYLGGWIREHEDVFEFSDGDAAWRGAIGWDGKGEPEGFARKRRRG
jgi:hypothetical protein